MSQTPQEIIAYTDGSCMPNPGPGGWGWAIVSFTDCVMQCQGSSYQTRTTNNRMELSALIDLLEYLAGFQGNIVVNVDSTYVINGYKKLLQTRRIPKLNADLWERLLNPALPPAELQWVKGHSNDPGNELVDKLAKKAVRFVK